MIHVAAPDSPQRYKDKADYQCPWNDVNPILQAAIDEGEAEKSPVNLGPGTYVTTDTVYIGFELLDGKQVAAKNQGCTITTEGLVRFVYVGKQAKWMMIYDCQQGQGNLAQAPSGILFDGWGVAEGLRVNNYHGKQVRDLFFSRIKGRALKTDSDWHCDWRNIRVSYSDGDKHPLIEMGVVVASLHNLQVTKSKAPEGILHLYGRGSTLTQIGFERVDCGDSPAVTIRMFGGSVLQGFSTERIKTPVLIHLKDSVGAKLEGLKFYQHPSVPGQIGVLLTGCEGSVVDRVLAWNYKDKIVRVAADCKDVEVRRVVDQTGTAKHIVDYAGRGARGD